MSNASIIPTHWPPGTPDTVDDLDEAVEALQADLARDVVERDRANQPPFDEVRRLRKSGLLLLPLDASLGGPGRGLRTIYSVVRRIAHVDPSTATLLGYHYQRVRHIARIEDPDRRAWVAEQTLTNQWYLGGTGSAQEDDLDLRPVKGGYLLNGRKNFSTGARVADRIFGSGTVRDTGVRLRTLLDPQRDDGSVIHRDWDLLGVRLSASGPLEFRDYFVAESDIVGTWPRDAAEQPPHRTIGVFGFQLTFVNLYVGIAEGALLAARDYTRTYSRPWHHAAVDKAVDDVHLLRTAGDLAARVQAASALKDQAVAALEWAESRGEDLTARERGEVAELICSAKIISTKVALEVTSRIFDLTGARSTQAKYGLDRFWRDVRTHSLHDPVAYKEEELGAFVLKDAVPAPSPYR